MGNFTKVVHRTVGGMAFVGAVFLIINMLIVVISVICRFFRSSFVGNFELIEISIGVAITSALAYAALAERHVIIDILLTRLREKNRKILHIVSFSISLCFLLVLVWATFGSVIDKFMVEEMSEHFGISIWPFRAFYCLGLFLFSLVFLIDIFSSVKGLQK